MEALQRLTRAYTLRYLDPRKTIQKQDNTLVEKVKKLASFDLRTIVFSDLKHHVS